MSDFINSRLGSSSASDAGNAASSASSGAAFTSSETAANRPRMTEFRFSQVGLALNTTFQPLLAWFIGERFPLSGTHPIPDAVNGIVAMQQGGLWAFDAGWEFDATVGNNIIIELKMQIREGTGPATFGPWTDLAGTFSRAIIRNTANPDNLLLAGRGSAKVGRARIDASGLGARSDDVRAATPSTPNSAEIFPDQFKTLIRVASGTATIDVSGSWTVDLHRSVGWTN